MTKKNLIKSIRSSLSTNCLPVPVGFNLPNNRMEIILCAHSDLSIIDIFLYEYHGLYWYSFAPRGSKASNSLGFFSLRNCVFSLRATVRALGFVLDDSNSLSRFVAVWENQGRVGASNAAHIRNS